VSARRSYKRFNLVPPHKYGSCDFEYLKFNKGSYSNYKPYQIGYRALIHRNKKRAVPQSHNNTNNGMLSLYDWLLHIMSRRTQTAIIKTIIWDNN